MDNKNIDEPLVPFISVAALKTAHAELLKRYREGLDYGALQDDNSHHLQALVPDIKYFIARGAITGKLIDSDDERAASQAYLDYWMTILFRAGVNHDDLGHVDATLDEFDPDLAPDIPEDRCPYLGLDAFQEQHRNIFFGRNAFVQQMLTTLGNERLLAVVGPSGSGKSSAVLAGLLPVLKSGALPESETWNYYAPMVPGSNPLRSLAVAIAPVGADSVWVEQQVKMFSNDYSHLCRLLADSSNSPSVLVIDQFEEIFTLCHDEAVLEAFVLNIMRAITLETITHRILITMRIEFQEQMPRLTALYPWFQRGLVHILPLSTVDLGDVIERPAAEVGLKFEQGIVENLVKEIIGEPAGLPLLQFTLLQLWRQRSHNRVLVDVYTKLGGARKALTNVATAVYQGLPIQEQVVAKRIFLRLAWAGEGVEILRNRVRRRLLHKVGGSHDIVDRVLKKLSDARLIRLSKDEFALDDQDSLDVGLQSLAQEDSLDDQFEVAHEALIRNWQLLIDWLQAEHQTLRQRIRVRSAAEQWKSHGKDPGGLIGGSLLIEASRYDDLDELEKEFIQASHDTEEATTNERVRARENELEQLYLLATEKSRAARRLRYVVVVLAAGILLVSVAATFAVRAKSSAVTQAQLAAAAAKLAEESRREAEHLRASSETQTLRANEALLLAEAEQKIAENAKRKLAVAALRLERESVLTEQALTDATENLSFAQDRQKSLTRELLEEHNDLRKAQRAQAAQPSFSADSTKILTFFAGRNAQVWDTRTQQMIADLESEHPLTAATLSADGRLVVTANNQGEIIVTDLSSLKTVTKIDDVLEGPSRLVLSADSKKLAVLYGDMGGGVRVIDLSTMRTIVSLSGGSESGPVAGMAFSESGDYLAVVGVFGQTSLIKTQFDASTPISLSKSPCVPAAIRLANLQPNPNVFFQFGLMTVCGQGDTFETPPNVDPEMRDQLKGSFMTARGLLINEYVVLDPHFASVAARLPEIQAALNELKSKVAEAQKAAPESLASQFNACNRSVNTALRRTISAIEHPPSSAKLGNIMDLLSDEFDEAQLRKVNQACGQDLNNTLRDAGVGEASRKVEALHNVVGAEYERIDKKGAEEKVKSEAVSVPVVEFIVGARKPGAVFFARTTQIDSPDYNANQLAQFMRVVTEIETNGISTEQLDDINDAILEFFRTHPSAAANPLETDFYVLVAEIKKRLEIPLSGRDRFNLRQ